MNTRHHDSISPLVAAKRWRGVAVCVVAGLLAGCNGGQVTVPGQATAQAASDRGEMLVRGVVHRAIPLGDLEGMDVVDIDLATSHVRLAVGAKQIRSESGAIVGKCLLPADWVKGGALAAVNGGYFGRDVGTDKEIVGLLVQHGRVRHAAPMLVGHGGNGLSPGRYVRSAFGIMPDGKPEIVWAATMSGKPQQLQEFAASTPRSAGSGRRWQPRDAIGCGPTLIARGVSVVTDREERLVSEGPRPRTFVAYDHVGGKPRHVVVGIASGAGFQELSGHIADYFRKYDKTAVWAAMCFDGGSSTQMTYRIGQNANSPRSTGVTVPDCLVIQPE